MVEPDGAQVLEVVIVEADRRVRRGLAGMLEAGGRLHVAAGVSTAAEALDAIEAGRPDLVVIDIDRPDADEWLNLIRRIRLLSPRSAIAVMSEAATLRPWALAAGAAAFVNKWSSLEDISAGIDALRPHEVDAGGDEVGAKD